MITNKDIFRPLINKSSSFATISSKIVGLNRDRYFDYTASGLAFSPIEDRIQELLMTYANTHSDMASDAKQTSFYYDEARKKLKKNLKLSDDFALIPCGTGATGAIKRFQELLGLYIPPATKKRFSFDIENIKKPLVVVGPFEHHSNEVSYREALCDIIRIPLDSTGNVDLSYLEKTLKENAYREIIGAFSIASNVTGIISPYREISKLLRQYGAVVAFDSAASSPCLNIDSSLFDALFLSPHKLVGGPGSCGLLAIRNSLIDPSDAPTFAGGGTVTYVSNREHRFNSNIEIREDAGTPAILQFVKASLVYQLREEIGIDRIQKRKAELFNILLKKLKDIEGIVVYGDGLKHQSVGILAINFKSIDPYILCEKLSKNFAIQTRAGCSCAGPYGHDLLGLSILKPNEKPGWLRISVNYTHSIEAIEYLIGALKKSIG